MSGQLRETLLEVDDAEFIRGLEQAVAELHIRTEQGLQRFGMEVANRAKQFCPVDTGRLRASIGIEPGKDAQGPYVDVGTSVTYGPYVEYGTSKARAQPFMRPALAEAAGFFGPTMTGAGGGLPPVVAVSAAAIAGKRAAAARRTPGRTA